MEQEKFPARLRTTLIGVISLAILLVMITAMIIDMYVLSRGLAEELRDKAALLVNTFDVAVQSESGLSDEQEIKRKIDTLKDSRHDIVEIDVVVPIAGKENQYRMLATTGHEDGQIEEAPDQWDVQVIKTGLRLTMLEVVDRKTGFDHMKIQKVYFGAPDLIKAFMNKNNIYVWEIIGPIHDNKNNIVGSIAIELSIDDVLVKAKEFILDTFIIFIGSLIGLVIVIWYSLSHFVLKPIYSLNEGIKTVKEGDLSYQLTAERNDEFGYLAQTYNDMISSLKKTRSEVDDLNRSLQERVNMATSELRKTNQTLAAKLDELKQTQHKLVRSERYAASALIAAGVAHEIRNPLSGIKLIVQHIQDKFLTENARLDPDYQELDNIFTQQVKQLDDLVVAFLDFTRPVKLHLSTVSTNELLTTALELSLSKFTSSGIQIDTSCDDNIPDMMLDKDMMKRALVHLIVNAMQAMPNGGILSIKSEFDEALNEVVILVKDTGQGIKQDSFSEIFEPFFSSRVGGVGLGLPIVRRTIEAHHGDISVVSEIDKGTEFRIQLNVNA